MLDFDGLAAMVAAEKLYPDAVKVYSGIISKNVRKFMSLYKDSLSIKSAAEVDINQVDTLVLVDTADPKRTYQMEKIFNIPDIKLHIYDHHPVTTVSLKGDLNEIHPLGAATTILVEKIVARDIEINSFEASILALGIYDDTGSLLFPHTTARDARAVAFLLEKGANLEIVGRFIDRPFTAEQRELLQEFLQNMEHYTIKNVAVAIAGARLDKAISGLDLITQRLLELEESELVITLTAAGKRVQVIGRSRTNYVNLNELLTPLGGGGHPRAASAVIKGGSLEETKKSLLNLLNAQIKPSLLAKDIMSSPVKTLPADLSLEEAGRIMLRYGHTGMPVMEGERMIGIISRRDVDKARMHKLGHAPVKGFMKSQVVFVKPETPVNEVQKIMVKNDIGRVPVISENKLVGIISRTDILRTWHGEDYPEDFAPLFNAEPGDYNYAPLLSERLPPEIISVLKMAGSIADQINSSVYLVGGLVRDLLLGEINYDFDLVVEGDGELLARLMGEKLGVPVRIHERFHTASVFLNENLKLDIATARTEYYEFPAALPTVKKSSLREDLYRRDFTINTMALCLNPSRFGNLIDYFGGREDLQNKKIRILYNFSFVEDPTRIIRAIRFAQRYGFTIDEDTLRFARDAIERNLLSRLSVTRIIHEIILILQERNPLPALKELVEMGVWGYIFPQISMTKSKWVLLEKYPEAEVWWQECLPAEVVKQHVVYLIILFSGIKKQPMARLAEKYAFERYVRKCLEESTEIPDIIEQIRLSDLRPSRLHEIIGHLEKENLFYILLRCDQQPLADGIKKYLLKRKDTQVFINGRDIKELGLPPGPEYKKILAQLYAYKLDGIINSKDEELSQVRKWLEEGNID